MVPNDDSYSYCNELISVWTNRYPKEQFLSSQKMIGQYNSKLQRSCRTLLRNYMQAEVEQDMALFQQNSRQHSSSRIGFGIVLIELKITLVQKNFDLLGCCLQAEIALLQICELRRDQFPNFFIVSFRFDKFATFGLKMQGNGIKNQCF